MRLNSPVSQNLRKTFQQRTKRVIATRSPSERALAGARRQLGVQPLSGGQRGGAILLQQPALGDQLVGRVTQPHQVGVERG